MNCRRFPLFALSLAAGLPLLTSACGAPVAVAVASYGADGISLVETGKSTTDHLASMASKKDCAFWRVLRGETVCREREGDKDPYDVNYDSVERQPSEDGVAYSPPLHAGSAAPPTAWTADVYKPAAAPEPSQPAAEPVVVEPETVQPPAPVPAKASTPKGKKKTKAHAKSVRKTSPGQVASGP